MNFHFEICFIIRIINSPEEAGSKITHCQQNLEFTMPVRHGGLTIPIRRGRTTLYGGSTLFISNIHLGSKKEDLLRLFGAYGRVTSLHIMTDFGFVTFEDAHDADDAVYHLHGEIFRGREIGVRFARAAVRSQSPNC